MHAAPAGDAVVLTREPCPLASASGGARSSCGPIGLVTEGLAISAVLMPKRVGADEHKGKENVPIFRAGPPSELRVYVEHVGHTRNLSLVPQKGGRTLGIPQKVSQAP